MNTNRCLRVFFETEEWFMLISLHVKNLAIIDEIEVDFREGLNILTGETGAGKSIIIGSINMALGSKATTDIIRSGKDYGLIELVFQMEDENVVRKMEHLELPMEDGQIIISRKIMKNRSICKVNGETVTMGIVRELASVLIDIHGQHEHQSLLHKQKHLEILDQFGRGETGEELDKLAKLYKEYQIAKQEYENKNITQEDRIRELSFMEYEKNEIEQAHIRIGEDEELASQYKRLSNTQLIAEGIQNVYQITAGGTASVSDEIGRAARYLVKISDYDEQLAGYLEQLQNIEEMLGDFNCGINEYSSQLEFDGESFQDVEERLNMYHGLKAKYGDTIEEIQSYYENLVRKIEEYQDYDLYLEKLKERCEKKEKAYLTCAKKISRIRKKNGKILSGQIKEALIDLNFLDVQFEVNIKDLERYTENGMDDVEFLISTNPGEAIRPLGKVASGGELSRIMLAIKSVLAEQDAIETLIFDEIDVGISGRTAQKVSEKMAVIARRHQVICITHLPQIAAMADEHFIIEKKVEGTSTVTIIRNLDKEGSIRELARILGGVEITDTVIHSAAELKEMAASIKKV